MSHGPTGVYYEHDVNEETNEANQTDSEMCDDDVKEVSNPRWVTVGKK